MSTYHYFFKKYFQIFYKVFSVIFIILQISTHSLNAQEILELEENFSSVPLGINLSILEDKSGLLEISDVVKPKYLNNFKQSSDQFPGFGFTDSTFWIKFTLHNNSNNIHWIIDQSFSNTNYLDLYIPKTSLLNQFEVRKKGNLQSSGSNDFPHRRVIFKIVLENNQQQTYFMRMQNHASSKIALMLRSETEFSNYDRQESFAMGVFYGLLLVILLLNLTLYLIFRINSYGYLVLFILFITTAYLFLDGYAQLFSPDYLLEKTQHVFHMALALAMSSLLLFTKSMLEFPKKSIRVYYSILVGWLLIFFLKPFSDFGLIVKFSIPLLFFTIIYLLFISFTNLNKKILISRMFILGFIIIVLSYTSQALIVFGVIDRSIFSDQGLRISLIILILMFSVSIIDHVQNLQNIWKLTNQALKKSQHLHTESEEKFYNIFQSSPNSIIITELDTGKITEVNPTFERMMGYNSGNLVGKSTLNINLWKNIRDRERIVKLLETSEFGHEPKLELLKKSGSTIVVDSHFFKIKISGKMYTVSTFLDVTEKSRQDQILRDIASAVATQDNFFNNLVLQLSKLFNSNYALIGLFSNNNDLLVTHAICEDDVIIDNLSYSVGNTPFESTMNNGLSIFPKELSVSFPKDSLAKEMNVESYIGTPLIDSKGMIIGILAVLNRAPLSSTSIHTEILQILAARAASEIERSISDKKFRNAQQKLSLHIEQTPLAAIEWNKNFEVVTWNSAAEKIFGYNEEEAKGKSAKNLIIPDEFMPHVDAIWSDLLRMQGGQRSSNENITKHGNTIYCEWYNTPLVAENGDVIGVASLAADKTIEYQSKQETQQKEQEQRAILSSIIDGVITIDEEGNILTCNNSAIRISGFSEEQIIGNNIINFISDKLSDRFEKNSDFVKHLVAAHSDGLNAIEGIGIRQDQSKFPIKVSIVKLKSDTIDKHTYVLSLNDLSDSKRQEEQLRRSQKMDALGKLTGGIAHDFNNLLGVIIGYSDLLDKTIEPDSKQSRYSSQIHRAAERGAKLTNKLLGFSRTKRAETTVLNINELLSSQTHLLEKTLTSRIKLQFEFADELWHTNIDAGDFEDAILNLCINSMHAIEGTGQITIKTSNKVINNSDAQIMQINAGEYVLVQITDSGCGMESTVIERIFDPFFTTKGEQGTGLGLSQVYGFVKNSNGALKVYSELGHGSQFNLYFSNHDSSIISSTPKTANKDSNLSGNETILVLDDEEPIRLMSEEILIQNGYNVYTAESPDKALELLKSKKFDLLLSDVIMPKMDGYQFAKIVQKEFPNVKIQLASGFTDDRQKNIKNELYYKQLLQKPYSADTLLATIRKLLDSKQES